MGCLKNFVRAIILTLIVVGFMAFGGQKQISQWISGIIHPTHDTLVEKAKKIGDFSSLNKEFEIEKTAGIMGYNAVLAEHKASGQKMIVIDSGKKTLLTREDIEASDAETRIKEVITKFKYQSSAIEDFHITEKGFMTSYGSQIPYAKFNARVKKLPIGEISGIVSVAKDKNGNDKVLVSANQPAKYSQLIANEFFKAIK